jgi:carboxyl-terminal processing protease
VIIGSTSTYGKGTVQRNIPLNPESENALFANKKTEDLGTVKLTLQKFYRISGGATQLKGVTPDIVLPDRLEHLKFREKDNPYALRWDEINKADYKTWTSTASDDLIISSANNDVNKSATFGKIKENVLWLEKYNDKEYSLNIAKYKEDQKKLKDVYKQIEDSYKLPTPLNIQNVAADTMAINAAQDKIDKNKQWIKIRSTDIYIDETVKVLNKMIAQGNTAKVN